eukprot:CAMPEP_0194144494 /NCGR_PEP_ID=MMETSP0152-20130528/13544_1 /TAXON_ID=1049557 /ORGANISM="Thalassiothrix antarctica, Strain L6-D1" /LENGTH=611 /DNA_ID=CAMNT_0038844375 /DNA_START=157 /DNA_END=1992 /DNA_ORIENTATION=-
MTPSTNKSSEDQEIPTPDHFLSTNEQFTSFIENDESDNLPPTLSGPLQNPTENNSDISTENRDFDITKNQPTTQIVDIENSRTTGCDLVPSYIQGNYHHHHQQQLPLSLGGELPPIKLGINTVSSISVDSEGKQIAQQPLSVVVNPTVATKMPLESGVSVSKFYRNQEVKPSLSTSLSGQHIQSVIHLNINKHSENKIIREANADLPPGPVATQSSQSGVTSSSEKTEMSPKFQVPSTVEVPSQLNFSQLSPPSHTLPKVGELNLLSSTDTRQFLNRALFHSQLQPDSQRAQMSSIQQPTQTPIPSSAHVKSKTSNSLRRGKWTVEEEAYVARVIQDFNSGYLNAPAGTTLRSYLSEKLHCDPMRITKKFTGDSCIGKRVFHPAVRCPSNTAAIDKAQAELDALERRWRRRLEMQQRESAKKAAASAAAAAAAASGRTHFHASNLPASNPVIGLSNNRQSNIAQNLQQSLVTQTASWLDRANAILSAGRTVSKQPESQPPLSGSHDHARAVKSLPQKEIEDQMKEVQRLIHEGPIIQQTTAGLPHLLENSSSHTLPQPTIPSTGEDEPADKRLRRTSKNDHSGAEDAEALVGFLNSVRAAAAAGTTNTRPP